MAYKIYTKTGDGGMTSLIGGTKISKSDLRIESYGNVDELNCCIGLCRDLSQDEAIRKVLLEIQDRLFTIGSSLACDPAKETKMKIPDLKEADVLLLEQEIDKMEDQLPEMKNFILPGGHVTVSQMHLARCVCRRAERSVVRLSAGTATEELLILKYLNRLSDYLFVLARYTGQLLGITEIPWKARL